MNWTKASAVAEILSSAAIPITLSESKEMVEL